MKNSRLFWGLNKKLMSLIDEENSAFLVHDEEMIQQVKLDIYAIIPLIREALGLKNNE